jgi:3-hydroxybutyryl-CoA dehydrogenase
MRIIIAGTQQQKKELLNGKEPDANIIWLDSIEAFADNKEADAYIDLLFENDDNRINVLQQYAASLVIINSVIHTLSEVNSSFIRINGWPTFLHAEKIEASLLREDLKQKTQLALEQLGKKVEWTADMPGFISPRIVSMIINEAFLCLQEDISNKENIDTAMKLGTGYPYGPFEWAEKIGLKNIHALVDKLKTKTAGFQPTEIAYTLSGTNK